MTSSRVKAAERQTVLKKILPFLKKYFKYTLPKSDRPVLDTMLYSVCLENLSPEDADRCYALFHQEFPDLNEARVSQVSELERAFVGMEDGEWRGYRMRAVLQFVFEKSFTFEFESLRKKTLELAVKQLAKLKQATPFMRSYVLQSAVGAHILPVDDRMKRFLVWMGLATPEQSGDEIGDALKSSVRKAEAALFCQAIRMVATDARVQAAIPSPESYPDTGFDPATALERLQAALEKTASKSKPKPAKPTPEPEKKHTSSPKKSASKPTPATKSSAKKKTAKSSGRAK